MGRRWCCELTEGTPLSGLKYDEFDLGHDEFKKIKEYSPAVLD